MERRSQECAPGQLSPHLQHKDANMKCLVGELNKIMYTKYLAQRLAPSTYSVNAVIVVMISTEFCKMKIY